MRRLIGRLKRRVGNDLDLPATFVVSYLLVFTCLSVDEESCEGWWSWNWMDARAHYAASTCPLPLPFTTSLRREETCRLFGVPALASKVAASLSIGCCEERRRAGSEVEEKERYAAKIETGAFCISSQRAISPDWNREGKSAEASEWLLCLRWLSC